MKTGITFTIIGSKQGQFTGDNEYDFQSQLNKAIRIDYEIIVPLNISTGQASGKRQHHPVTLTHPVGASSTQLYNALVTNEHLTQVYIYFTAIQPDGIEYALYQIRLTNARISRIYLYTENMELLEDISLTFQSIEETHIPSAKMAFDDWLGMPR